MDSKQTMKAAVYERYGPPEVLELKTVPVPSYGDDDLLIQVHFSTVNRTDCAFLRAAPFLVRMVSGLTKPKSTILGCEFSGSVVATGSAVSKFNIGDRVFGFADDDYGFGGHAQFTSMSAKGMIAKIPEHVSFAQAAAGLEGSHYALNGIRSAGVHKNQHALVNGATGAIGSAAVQLMRAMGAEVTGVCATGHLKTVAKLGASRVIDYLNEDFTQVEAQYDMVFDAVGKSSFGLCKPILKEKGIYISSELGDLCQNPLLALYTPLFSNQQVHFPIPKNSQTDADYIASLLEKKQFMPLIDRTYPLEQIRDAYHYVETGEKIGNVLLELNPSENGDNQ